MGFLAKSQITGTRRMRELSKGMKTQVHLALTMAIDAKLLVLDEPTLGLDILARRGFYDALVNDYMDENAHHRDHHASSRGNRESADRCDLHRQGPHRARLQPGEHRAAFLRRDSDGEKLAAARALKPFYERHLLGKTVLYYEGTTREQLSEFGELHTPTIARSFSVAKLSGDAS